MPKLIGALQREGLTAALSHGHGHVHGRAARERESPGVTHRVEPLASQASLRHPSAISQRISPMNPDTEIPDVSTAGWDADGLGARRWARYRSFHWEPTPRWGIYVTDEGIWRLADRLRLTGLLPATQPLELLRSSMDILMLHEFFHFLTDVASSRLELARPGAARPMYLPYAKRLASALPSVGLEEALANAFVDRRLRPTGLRPALRAVFDAQPGGYQDFVAYLGRALSPGCRALAGQIAAGDARDAAGDPPLELLFDLDVRHYGFGEVPVWLVNRLHATPYALTIVDAVDAGSRLPRA